MVCKNIGPKDRLIRAIFSFLLFIAAYVTESYIILAIALFVAYEALASWCIIYTLLGKSSLKK